MTLSHSGMGTDPVASPTASDGCAEGTYAVGEPIVLVSVPDPGWTVSGWQGTDDDSSRSKTNELTMPDAPVEVSVDYEIVP